MRRPPPWEVHSLALTGLAWLAWATPAACIAADAGRHPEREAALRTAARLRGDIAAVRVRWEGLRSSPSAERCRAHVAAVERVEGALGELADALERFASAAGEAEALARAATAGAADCRHQQGLAESHARAVALLCDVLPVVPEVPTPSPTVEQTVASCVDGVSFTQDVGIVFATGRETEAWLAAGGGRQALGVLERTFEGLPEIVVIRFAERRLGVEGLRGSVRLPENRMGVRDAAPGASRPSRVVVFVGAEDQAAEAAVNFAAAWAFVPSALTPACRPGAVDAFWFAEGTSVLSFGRRGLLTKQADGTVEWRSVGAAGAPEADGVPVAPTPSFSPAEQVLMGLSPAQDDPVDRARGVRWLAGARGTPDGVAQSSVVCHASLPVVSRAPGVGPSMRLIVVSKTPLSPEARRDHLAWWRAYTAANRDARPEISNFFEATGERARPSVDGQLAPRRACGAPVVDLP